MKRLRPWCACVTGGAAKVTETGDSSCGLGWSGSNLEHLSEEAQVLIEVQQARLEGGCAAQQQGVVGVIAGLVPRGPAPLQQVQRLVPGAHPCTSSACSRWSGLLVTLCEATATAANHCNGPLVAEAAVPRQCRVTELMALNSPCKF